MSKYSNPCAVSECGRLVGPHGAKGMCPTHYNRARNWGSAAGKPCATCGHPFLPHAAELYCLEACVPACSVEGCESPSRTRTWCADHYSQWTKRGEVKPLRKWSAVGGKCVVCSEPVVPGSGRRKHCSGRCQAMDSRHKGNRPVSTNCVACGDLIDFLAPTRKGQFRRVDSKLCGACKKQTRWALTADELAKRDGTVCGICGNKVDMSLRYPDVMRASVDHIEPRANGGLDVPENLQLSHLHCNTSKSNRTVNNAVRL